MTKKARDKIAAGLREAIAVARDEETPPNVSIICESLEEQQWERRCLIKSINRHSSEARALIERALGWELRLPEEEREKIEERARDILSQIISSEMSFHRAMERWEKRVRKPLPAEDKTVIARTREPKRKAKPKKPVALPVRKPLAPEDAAVIANVRRTINALVVGIFPLCLRRDEVEKQMVAGGRLLPVAAWQKGVIGFGDLALAVLVGETGDLSNYPNFRHVWKRLGLMPIDGRALSTWRSSGETPPCGWADDPKTGKKGAGYSPHRRAEIYACIADPMAKMQLKAAAKSGTEFGEPVGPYGDVYVERRKKTKLEHPDWTKKHAQMDALRIMTKALVSDLWSEWRRQHTPGLNAR